MSSAPAAKSLTGGFTETALETFLKNHDEPLWLRQKRRDAFAQFQALPWPSLRDEEWRRTDIRGLKLADFAPPAPHQPTDDATATLASRRESLGTHYAAGIEHVDAAPIATPAVNLPGGAIFTDLGTAARQHPELLERYLMTRAVDPGIDTFSALHAAFWTGGTLLYVPKGVVLETPLSTLVGLSASGRADLHHTLVILEEGAKATLVQEYAGASRGKTPGLHVGAVELIVGEGARLRFVNIQDWDDSTWHFSRERAVVGRDGLLQWTVGGLGSRLAKVNQEVALAGEGANAQVNGVMFTSARQHLAYFTRQDHQAPHTTSDLLYKGGLKGRSRIVWKGMIRVEKEAQRTDAYQKNDNLHLSNLARADSIPGLEIEANDVRCTHGATAGRVDDEMLFYCQSRGIDKETAIRLVVEGFFANVYDRITLEPVRETLRQAVAAKLNEAPTATAAAAVDAEAPDSANTPSTSH